MQISCSVLPQVPESCNSELRRHLEAFRKLVRFRKGLGLSQGTVRSTRPAEVWGEGRNFVGQLFWAGGHFVSTVGRDETVIRDTTDRGRRRTSGSTRSTCGAKRYHDGAARFQGRVSDPDQLL